MTSRDSSLRDADQIDANVLHYVLVHRSRMHMIALRRQLSDLQRLSDLRAKYPVGAVRSGLGDRSEVFIQAAIGQLLKRNDVRDWLARKDRGAELGSRETLYEVLYYASRSWSAAEAGKRRFDPSLRALRAYLVARQPNDEEFFDAGDSQTPDQTAKNRPGKKGQQSKKKKDTWVDSIPKKDFDLFEGLLQAISAWLSSPETLRREIECAADRSVPIEVLHAFPAEPLLSPESPDTTYLWNHTVEGAPLVGKTRMRRVDDARRKQILEIDQFVRNHSDQQITLENLADEYAVLPTSPAWPQVEGALARNGDARDANLVDEYHAMLQSYSSILAGALAAAITLGHASAERTVRHPMTIGLYTLSTGYRFAECYKREIEVLVRTACTRLGIEFEADEDLFRNGWQERLKLRFHDAQALNVKEYQARAWDQWKSRFDREFANVPGEIATSVDEILCGVAGIEPANTLGQGVSKIDDAAWSKLYFDAFGPWQPGSSRFCPFWSTAAALKRLGFHRRIERFDEAIQSSLRGLVSASQRRKQSQEDRLSERYQKQLSESFSLSKAIGQSVAPDLEVISNWVRNLSERPDLPEVAPVFILPKYPGSDLIKNAMSSKHRVIVLPTWAGSGAEVAAALLGHTVRGMYNVIMLVELDSDGKVPEYQWAVRALALAARLCFVGSVSDRKKREIQQLHGPIVTPTDDFELLALKAENAVLREKLRPRTPLRSVPGWLNRGWSYLSRGIPHWWRSLVAFLRFRSFSLSERFAVGRGRFWYRWHRPWPELTEALEESVPVGCAINSRGQIYVLTRDAIPVRVFDQKCRWINNWGESILRSPHGICARPDDTVCITDVEDHTVRFFSEFGDHLTPPLGNPGTPADTGAVGFDPTKVDESGGPFNRPTHVAVAANGEIYVADGYANARVHRFASYGSLMGSIGQPGKGKREFQLPSGIGVDRQGRVYVADRENNRIQVLDADLKFITEWTGLNRPCDLLVDADDNVFVVELGTVEGKDETRYATGGRLSVFDADGTLRARWNGRSVPGGHQRVFLPYSICGDAGGNLIVTALDLDPREVEELRRVARPDFTPTENAKASIHLFERFLPDE